MLHVYEYRRSPAVFEKFHDLVVMQGRIQWNRNAARGDDTEVSRDPARMVVGKDGKPRSGSEIVFRDPAPDGLGPALQFTVGAAFEVVVTLEFECDVIRPALGALQKTVVERGHGSWGILQEKGTRTQCSADYVIRPR